MGIPFADFFHRLQKETGIATQMDLAHALGVNRSAITQAKTRDAVPQKWILALARRYSLSPDWLEFGRGVPRGKDTLPPSSPAKTSPVRAAVQAFMRGDRYTPGATAAAPTIENELVYVPKARARLCAGGGSFEVGALPVAEYPFPRQWLTRMGDPSRMVFMDVVGDSMEPGICDGDMVMVDQSNTAVSPHNVMAVGVEDAIYLKRVEQRGGGIILHSDNKTYSCMELYDDELNTFRILGKVVWLCRDFRHN